MIILSIQAILYDAASSHKGDRTRPRSSHKRILRKTKPPNKPRVCFGDPAAVARFRSGLMPPPDGVVAQGDRTRPRSSHKRISRKTKPPNKSEALFW